MNASYFFHISDLFFNFLRLLMLFHFLSYYYSVCWQLGWLCLYSSNYWKDLSFQLDSDCMKIKENELGYNRAALSCVLMISLSIPVFFLLLDFVYWLSKWRSNLIAYENVFLDLFLEILFLFLRPIMLLEIFLTLLITVNPSLQN